MLFKYTAVNGLGIVIIRNEYGNPTTAFAKIVTVQWYLHAGQEALETKFLSVGLQHLEQYIALIEDAEQDGMYRLPNTEAIEDSYRKAVEDHNLPATTAIDSLFSFLDLKLESMDLGEATSVTDISWATMLKLEPERIVYDSRVFEDQTFDPLMEILTTSANVLFFYEKNFEFLTGYWREGGNWGEAYELLTSSLGEIFPQFLGKAEPDVIAAGLGLIESIQTNYDYDSAIEILLSLDNNGDDADLSLQKLVVALSKQFYNIELDVSGMSRNEALLKAKEVVKDFHENNYDWKIIDLTSLSALDIAQKSAQNNNEGKAFRYALNNQNPFVIIGNNHELPIGVESQADTLEDYSKEYLHDRSVFLKLSIERNKNNKRDHHPILGVIDEFAAYVDHQDSTKIQTFAFAPADKVSNHIFGSSGSETLEGNDLDDFLYGASGNDTLNGGKQKDHLEGGKGNDTLTGGKGNDTLIGGKGDDTYIYNTGDGNDVIDDTFGINQLVINNKTITKVTRIADSDLYEDEQNNRYLYYDNQLIVRVRDDDNTGSIRFKSFNKENNSFGITFEEAEEIKKPVVDDSAFNFGDGDPSKIPGFTTIYRLQKIPGSYAYRYHSASQSLNQLNNRSLIMDASLYKHDDARKENYHYGEWSSAFFGGLKNDELKGDDYQDALYGLAGDDVIYGGGDKDTLEGGSGSDYIEGGEGQDLIWGSGGRNKYEWQLDENTELNQHELLGVDKAGDINVLHGNGGSDFITGGEHTDYAYGGEGLDTIAGGTGDDVLSGNQENDLIYGDSRQYVGFKAFKGEHELKPDVRFVKDIIYSAGLENQYSYNDVISGGEGNDVLLGEQGDDIITGETGEDIIYGDRPSTYDELFESIPRKAFGDTNSQLATEYHGRDMLYGNDGDDIIVGNGNDDRLYGGADNDTLYGDAREEESAVAGNDHLYGEFGNDLLHGGAGDDVLDGGEGDDQLYGDEGNDILSGGAGTDFLRGGEGDDIYHFKTGDGYDVVWDTEGNNIIDLTSTSFSSVKMAVKPSSQQGQQIEGDVLAIQLPSKTDVIYIAAFNTRTRQLLPGAEQITFNFADRQNITISDFMDSIIFENGSPKDDDVEFRATPEQPNFKAGDSRDSLYGNAQSNHLEGNAGNDWLYGYDGNDILDGGDGDDVIEGGKGDDILLGGAGNDDLEGGHGFDKLIGGPGNDSLSFGSEGVAVFGTGDGIDEIFGVSSSSEQNITLQIKDDITQDQLRFLWFGNALVIGFKDNYQDFFIFGKYLTEDHKTRLSIELPNGDIITEFPSSGFFVDEKEYGSYRGYNCFINGGSIGYGVSGPSWAKRIDGVAISGTDESDIMFGSEDSDYIENKATNGAQQNDYIDGREGDDIIITRYQNATILGGEGNDEITSYGYGWNESDEKVYISGGKGNDKIALSGKGTIIFNKGDGKDTLNINQSARLEFKSPITRGDLSFFIDGQDLLINFPWESDQIRISRFITGEGLRLDGVPLVFADGSELTTKEIYTELYQAITKPIANPDSYTIKEDSTISIDVQELLRNDRIGGDNLAPFIVEVFEEKNGQLDRMEFIPDADFTGTASFKYRLSNGFKQSEGEVTVIVESVNDAPIIKRRLNNIRWQAGDEFSYRLPANSFYDPDADDTLALAATLTDGKTLPDWLQFDVEQQRFIGEPPADFSGDLAIKLTATDNAGESVSQSFTLTILPADDTEDTSSTTGKETTPELSEFAQVKTGTNDAEQLLGSQEADLIKGLGGNDRIFAFNGDDYLQGGDGDDRLNGGNGSGQTSDGNDTLEGGAGNDVLYGEAGDDHLVGGTGDDHYYYGVNGGVDTIDNTGGGNDWLFFINGITREQLSYHREDDDLIVRVDGDASQQVRVLNHFKGGDFAIKYIQPSGGGYAIPTSSIERELVAQPGAETETTENTNTDKSQTTTENSENTTDSTSTTGSGTNTAPVDIQVDSYVQLGSHSNDLFTGTEQSETFLGGAGDDTYVFKLGGGHDTIIDTQGKNRLVFEGIQFNQVGSNLFKSGNDLQLSVSGTEDKVIIKDFFTTANIDTIAFKTGGEIKASQLFGIFGLSMPTASAESQPEVIGDNQANTLTGTEAGEVIKGFSGNDSITGGQGNDTLIGGRGDDTYTFKQGDGVDTIIGEGGGTDTIHFDGFSYRDIAYNLFKMGNNLELGIKGAADKLIIKDFFLGGDNVVDTMTFSGGGQLTAQQVFQAFGIDNPNPVKSPNYQGLPNETDYSVVFKGDGVNEAITGSNSADWLEAGAGNDVLAGGKGDDVLLGGSGHDTYQFKAGDGQDLINNLTTTPDQDIDVLNLSGIAKDKLWLTQEGDDLKVDVIGSNDQVTIQNWFADEAYRLDKLETENAVLSADNVDSLVQAMAGFNNYETADGNLAPEVQAAINPILAASWQSK
ncbi:calcium-binding protein [Spartinivicinus ruber]|uniref:calcium-binding protein n=1 Tax=Spartinivicinus ruber TaxID=2683272 RepID=UPI0013D6AAD8|nr:calcium-binding protein [Spartinivicinus ruber]